MQVTASEREEILKAAQLEVSRLEREAEGFAHRLKSYDESEQRYKDENWNLETQVQELIGQGKEAASKEQKLQQALALATSEKNTAFRELDDLKQNHGKITEDNAILRRNQESELGNLRRNLNSGEHERLALQRKVEELNSQNQELAKAVASRFRDQRAEATPDEGLDNEAYPVDRSDSEYSPPPSPTKGNQRHSMLESETLKSSLHHAHRMIQNLKGNVHREKTEKLELKRLLQEARDEIEMRRSEGNHDQRHLKPKPHAEPTKKMVRPNMLGAGRNSKTDIMVDETGWEDHNSESSPQIPRGPRGAMKADPSFATDMSDAYQTANETEDGFETAHERDYPTENEAFQTGAESMVGDSSEDMTETEEGVTRGGTIRGKRPSALLSSKTGNRASYMSTASTSADEEENDLHTPNHTQPQRYRLKMNRGSRRSHIASESLDSNPSTAKNSPASFMGTGGQGNQSLFAELGDINGAESGEEGTPSRSLMSQRSTPSIRQSATSHRSNSKRRGSVSSQRSTTVLRPETALYSTEPPVPRLPVVDSGTMTEPWEPQPSNPNKDDIAFSRSSTTLKDSTPSKGLAGELQSEPPSTPQNHSSIPSQQNSGSRSKPEPAPPRTVWDQPLSMFSNIIPTFGPATNTTPLSSNSATTQDNTKPPPESPPSVSSAYRSADEAEPETPIEQRRMQSVFQLKKAAPQAELSFSVIQGIESIPIEPVVLQSTKNKAEEVAQPLFNDRSLQQEPPSGMETTTEEPTHEVAPNFARKEESTDKESSPGYLNPGVTSRIISSIFGSSQNKEASKSQVSEDDFSQKGAPTITSSKNVERRALKELPANMVQGDGRMTHAFSEHPKPAAVDMSDHSSQTLLSALQIDNMLKQKDFTEPPKLATSAAMKPLSDIGASSPPLPNLRSQDMPEPAKVYGIEQASKEGAPLSKGLKRPTSINSMRTSSALENHPPLPPNHQQAIAAAAQRTTGAEPAGVMGPPLAPASAYRTNAMRPRTPSRSKTPTDQRSLASPSLRNNTTPRTRYSTTRSRTSRRSSVSSFESELDERFNIRLDGIGMPDGAESNTDPRMIQAITQTMIGEYLWKYTRKAGRGDMSKNRHLRFFWVHPYTRTLYWSDRDPSIAGRAELKAKSVAIEAVRVVVDDNPMPPGLHRKSLVIVTPGRSVKFTAQTSQHHETWFNALSYLLLRTGPHGQDPGNNITAEDIAEFNPNYSMGSQRNHTGRSSRISLASFRSGGREPPPMAQRSSSRHSTRQPTGAPSGQSQQQTSTSSRYSQQQPQTQQSRRGSGTNRRDSNNQMSIGTRISNYWKPGRASSVASRNSSQQSVNRAETAGVYRPNSSAAGSMEGVDELGRMRGGAGAGADLENVRSCCDGEF